MSRYETRVKVWFYSEGASPSVIVKKLLALGFKPLRGAYDFVYLHSEEDMTEKHLGSAILEISDALHKALIGFKVLYNLDTRVAEEDSDIIHLDVIDAELEATRKELESIGE